MTSELIKNGSFEDGLDHWKHSPLYTVEIVDFPHTGTKAVKLSFNWVITGSITQTLDKPVQGTNIVNFSFWKRALVLSPYLEGSIIVKVYYTDGTVITETVPLPAEDYYTEVDLTAILHYLEVRDKFVKKISLATGGTGIDPIIDDVSLIADVPPEPEPPEPLTLYEHYNTGDDLNAHAYGLNQAGQTFTVGAEGHDVTHIKLKLYREGYPKDVTISIKPTDGGIPIGDDLTSVTIDGNNLPTNPSGVWVNFKVPKYLFSPNTMYAIVVKAPNGSWLNMVQWRTDSTDSTYDGGTRVWSEDGGSTWNIDTNMDNMFEIWGGELPPPPPLMEDVGNPNRQVKVEDDDVSQDAITTLVELRENAINMVILTANNEDGVNYLSTLHINDEVVVKMIRDSNPPTPIDWDGDPLVKTVFKGNIQELSPILNKAGQIARVVAYGKGYGLKEMRVADIYLAMSPIIAYPNVYEFIDPKELDNWNTWYITLNGAPVKHGDNILQEYAPWIDKFDDAYISIPIRTENLESIISAFNIINLGQGFRGYILDTAELHFVGGIIDLGLGRAISGTLIVYYSLDNGETWEEFTDHITFTDDMYEYGVGGNTYDPINDYPNVPDACGEDQYIDIIKDFNTYKENMLIKIKFYAYGGDPLGELGINYCYLKLVFHEDKGNTVRQIIAGPTNKGTDGIIKDYVEKVVGTNLVSGYSINTDYVYGYEDTDYIPYMHLPYEDSLTSIMDIIKSGSAVRFNQPAHKNGLHWIIDIDGNLLVAPVDDHDVYGASGEYLISSKWVLQPYATAIKVKVDMVTQAFKQEVPLANYILIAGKFLSPFNDLWCELCSINIENTPSWRVYQDGNWDVHKEDFIKFDTTNFMVGTGSILLGHCPNSATLEAVIPLHDQPTDFTKLMGINTTPIVKLHFRKGGWCEHNAIRLYKDKDNYFEYEFTTKYDKVNDTDTDIWNGYEIKIPNVKFSPSEGAIKKKEGTVYPEQWVKVGTPSWEEIYYIGLKYSASWINYADCWLDGLQIEGTIIKGAYDSNNINGPITINGVLYPNGFGCRTLTIKNSIANTDRIDVEGITDTKSPLVLECIYELLRHRKVRVTGEIAIPLDPIWMQGQQVWLQAEQDVEGNYKIDGWFRITKVTHEFNDRGALTRLEVTDDLENAVPINSNDVYTVIMRAINIDFQTRTMGSLKSGADFNLGIEPIVKDYA